MSLVTVKEQKFQDIDLKEIPKYLGKEYKTCEQTYAGLKFTIHYSKPKMKASQIMAMRRTGYASPKSVENTNKIASILAGRVIEGDAIIESSAKEVNESSVNSTIAQIIQNIKNNPSNYIDLFKDPRMTEAFNSLKEVQERAKEAKKEANMPEDVKKAIAELRASRK